MRERVYQTMVFDSSRWARFSPRDGDVIVCTSYKAGTTWTQMICLLLIHQTPTLPAPLAEISPWLDMRTEAIEAIMAGLEAQPFRRVIKTHTPRDGIPDYDNVTYVVCGRDPRDVFMSLQNHMANTDVTAFGRVLAAQGVEVAKPPPLPDDTDERFRLWLTAGTFPWESDGRPYWSHMRHAQTFWEHRDRANIHLLHYADLKADLEGQMRRVARLLNIDVEASRWPSLVEAASFEHMKSNADRTAPETNHGLWRDNRQFFNRGANAQWRGVLSEASLRLYRDIVSERYDAALMQWLEDGSLAAGEAKPTQRAVLGEA